MTKTIQNESKIKAIGVLTHGACKAVICIDTGEVYASATDAARENGISVHSISKNCLGKIEKSGGKRYCYVKDVIEHLGELTGQIILLSEKANKYDALTAHDREIEETEAKLAKYKEKYSKLTERLTKLSEAIVDTEAKLNALKANEACA